MQDLLEQKLTQAMMEIFGEDAKRIGHALAVLDWAKKILATEPGDPDVVVAAAILHDIGIHEAERKHGSSAGVFQEKEGPPIARGVLEQLNFHPETTTHVCQIVGSHHTAKDIDTLEFRILWDADWLVNLPDVFQNTSQQKLKQKIERIFKTKTGKNLANEVYLHDIIE